MAALGAFLVDGKQVYEMDVAWQVRRTKKGQGVSGRGGSPLPLIEGWRMTGSKFTSWHSFTLVFGGGSQMIRGMAARNGLTSKLGLA